MTAVFYGIDFSGANDAGEKIRVAEAEPSPDGLRVTDCWLAADRFDGAAREHVLPELVRFVASLPADAAVGLDAPFSLPRALRTSDDWERFLFSFPTEFADPVEFRRVCQDRARLLDGDRVEYLRATDADHDALCAYGFLLNTAAFHAMRDVVRPLVLSGLVAVPPFHPVAADAPTLVEAYPAGTLDALSAPRTKYKEDTDSARERRMELLDALSGHGVTLEGVRGLLVDDASGDSLDSVLAAYAVSRHAPAFDADPANPSEGHIFV